jgi:hypothetical protein
MRPKYISQSKDNNEASRLFNAHVKTIFSRIYKEAKADEVVIKIFEKYGLEKLLMAVLLKRDVTFWHYRNILKNQDLVNHLHLPKLFNLISHGTFDEEFLFLISKQKKVKSLLLNNSDINRIYVNPFKQNSYMVSNDFAELVSKHLNLKHLKMMI